MIRKQALISYALVETRTLTCGYELGVLVFVLLLLLFSKPTVIKNEGHWQDPTRY